MMFISTQRKTKSLMTGEVEEKSGQNSTRWGSCTIVANSFNAMFARYEQTMSSDHGGGGKGWRKGVRQYKDFSKEPDRYILSIVYRHEECMNIFKAQWQVSHNRGIGGRQKVWADLKEIFMSFGCRPQRDKESLDYTMEAREPVGEMLHVFNEKYFNYS